MTEADKKILACLSERKSFLIDAGAGSGKTSSLIRALDFIRGPSRNMLIKNGQRVACITFTNVAKNEIIERTDHDPLFEVSTIHDFLWGIIKSFQKELMCALLTFNAELPANSRRKQDAAIIKEALLSVPSIIYSDRGANFLEGRIFHDDLLGIAQVMFRSYPMLSKIVAAKFPFVFVDEYQDTDPKVISILLDHLKNTDTRPVIGFFGDKLQSIYSNGIGEMPDAHQAGLVTIQKEENYRCSKAVIDLLNNIRTDIKQIPAGNNAEGAAVYVGLGGINPDDDITMAALKKAEDNFGLKIEGELKILFLTHRLIARKAGYQKLWEAYSNRGDFAKDSFQAGEDPIASFLTQRIDRVLEAWRNGRVGLTISLIGVRKKSIAAMDEKRRVKETLDELDALASSGATINVVLKLIRESELMPLPDELEETISGKIVAAEDGSSEAKQQAFISELLSIPYQEVSNYRAVLENNLPYSTKHGVKGDQFKNVLVVLDDAGAKWNQYSFGNLLVGRDKSEERLQRTRNLFYVCCSRAIDKLIVAHVGSGDKNKLETLFGNGAVAV
ncbi:MAG: UvrD-helicase domain-containing protein [Alphaproteobacteria bacterium]|nr:UvrD-helicase domain-containing protein [Alphaproteobacteria bacterium]